MRSSGQSGAIVAAGEDWRAVVAEIISEHEGVEGAVLPVLHAVQHRLGRISEDALAAVAEGLHLTSSQLYAVATFYSEFRLGPRPAHQVTICRGPACRANGGRAVRRRLEELLGVEVGEESDDHGIAIDSAGCHGVCPHAPAIIVDGVLIGKVTVDDVEAMVAGHHPRANLSRLAANGKAPAKAEVGKMTAAYETLVARGMALQETLAFLEIPRLIVGISGCGLSVGAAETLSELKAELARRGIEARVEPTGCKGMCYCEPQVDVVLPGKSRVTYGNVTADRVAELVESVLVRGDLRSDWAECHWGEETLPGIPRSTEHPFLKDQTRYVTANWGLIDPENLESSIAAGAYAALDRALSEMTPEQVIAEVTASGISGRGGAAFPAGIKWQAARASRDRPKYVICNGEEGEPAIYKDRRMLEADPHRVIEGALINGYAIGAEHAYIYVGGEHYVAIDRLTLALAQAERAGLVGKSILGTDFSMDIQIRTGAGSYAVGESSAIMSSVEGRRGQPRPKLVRSAERGVWAKPTCMNNVETHANIPLIITRGAAWYSAIGTSKSKGTKIFALSGNVTRPGLIEAPMGTTLRRLIETAGGMRPGRTFKAAQPGGVSSSPIGTEQLDVQMALETLGQINALLGSGGIVVFDDSVCMVDMTRYLVNFSELESCSRCTACRVGSMRLTDILSRIGEGEGRMEDFDTLDWLKGLMEKTTLCGLGQAAATPAFGAAKVFRAEFEAHIREKRCPAGVCETLVRPAAQVAR